MFVGSAVMAVELLGCEYSWTGSVMLEVLERLPVVEAGTGVSAVEGKGTE